MYEYEYPKVDVTCTMFVTHKGKLLLGYRRNDIDTFPGELCLPGGFLMAKMDNLRRTASKETMEEARILIGEERWKLAGESSDWPGPDPRGHIVNILWHVEVTDSEYTNAQAGDDIKSIIWLEIRDMIHTGVPVMAFNHTILIEDWIADADADAAGAVSIGENVMIGGKLISGDFKT